MTEPMTGRAERARADRLRAAIKGTLRGVDHLYICASLQDCGAALDLAEGTLAPDEVPPQALRLRYGDAWLRLVPIYRCFSRLIGFQGRAIYDPGAFAGSTNASALRQVILQVQHVNRAQDDRDRLARMGL